MDSTHLEPSTIPERSLDCGPPGSSVNGIFQTRKLVWGAISSLRDLLDPGMEPRSPALQVDSLLTQPPGKRTTSDYIHLIAPHVSTTLSNGH